MPGFRPAPNSQRPEGAAMVGFNSVTVRPRSQWEPDAAIGIDVRAPVRAGVVDEQGAVLDSDASPPGSEDALEEAITAVVDELRARHTVDAVGLAVAGFVRPDRQSVMFAPHLPWRGHRWSRGCRSAWRAGGPGTTPTPLPSVSTASGRHGARTWRCCWPSVPGSVPDCFSVEDLPRCPWGGTRTRASSRGTGWASVPVRPARLLGALLQWYRPRRHGRRSPRPPARAAVGAQA